MDFLVCDNLHFSLIKHDLTKLFLKILYKKVVKYERASTKSHKVNEDNGALFR